MKSGTILGLGLFSLFLAVGYGLGSFFFLGSPDISDRFTQWDRFYWIVIAGLPLRTNWADSFFLPAILFTGIAVIVLVTGLLQKRRERRW